MRLKTVHAKSALAPIRYRPGSRGAPSDLAEPRSHAAVAEPRWPTFFDVVAAERPDIIVIAGSLFPTHAIEAARYLGDGFNTRNIPVIVVDVADNLERARSSAPRARIVDGVQLADAVRAALTKPIAT